MESETISRREGMHLTSRSPGTLSNIVFPITVRRVVSPCQTPDTGGRSLPGERPRHTK